MATASTLTTTTLGKKNTKRQECDENMGHGLHNLVEAATALTQLVNRIPTSTHTVSDDDSTQLDGAAIKKKTESQKNETIESPTSSAESSNPPSKQSPTKPENNKEIFPQRLMHILSQAAISDIITWLSHGRAFVIIRPGDLAEKILPRYFPESCSSPSKALKKNGNKPSSCKYPSFTRKLNRWGFRLLSRGPDAGAFHHQLFRRDEPDLCLRMVCQRSRRRKNEELGSTTQPSKIRKRSNNCMKLPTSIPKISPSSTDNESVSSAESSPKKHKLNNMSTDNVVTAPSITITTSTHGDSKPTPIPSSEHHVSLQSLSSISALPPPQATTLIPGGCSNSGVTINPKSQVTNESFPTSLPIAAVLQDKTYLDSRALLEHNLAINAAIAMAQAANVQQQQVQVPSLASFLVNTLNAQNAETQHPLQKPTLMTINAPSSITTSLNSVNGTRASMTCPNPSTLMKKSKAEERAASAKSMLYNAFLQALR